MTNEGTALKRIKALEITKAYAEHKMRITGDLDSDLNDWMDNIRLFVENEKAKK
jgi:hypothetical protein